jgi:hypothetical protein
MLHNKIKKVLRPPQLSGNILAYFVVASLTNQYNFIALALVRKRSSLFCSNIIDESIKVSFLTFTLARKHSSLLCSSIIVKSIV